MRPVDAAIDGGAVVVGAGVVWPKAWAANAAQTPLVNMILSFMVISREY
jgi:hypothetical protein